MSLSLLYPLVYLVVGFLAGRLGPRLRSIAAQVLSIIIIPFVVFYSIATSSPSVLFIIFGIMLFMIIALGISTLFTKREVVTLCFFYLNIGWLGLPVANAAFGDNAARFFIAMYVGGSVIGNSVGAGILGTNVGLPRRICSILTSPTAVGFYVGLALMPFASNFESHLAHVYLVSKWAMSFLGMAILGMWLATSPFRYADAIDAGRLYLLKTSYWLVVGIAVLGRGDDLTIQDSHLVANQIQS